MSTFSYGIKTGWWSFELPKYRPHPSLATYSLFAYDDLPPIRQGLDEEFRWLVSQPTKERSLLEGCDSDGSQPDLNKLSKIIEQVPVHIPSAFFTFIRSTELHKRIRSCTDCYLDVAEQAVTTIGVVAGYLIHFLSDSQWLVHWYLHLDSSGKEFVLVSTNAYGFELGDSNSKKKIDLVKEDIWFCAPTFAEFIYRFWLENEIWFALAQDKRPLSEVEQSYVDHYSKISK